MTSPTDQPPQPAARARLVEPLLESAPLALRLAPDLCRYDAAAGENCSWYHGAWQYRRLTGMPTSSSGQSDFFFDTLHAFALTGECARVLVSGSADYSTPAQVMFAYEQAGAPLALSVIDRCPTPLFLTRWYANRVNQQVTTICGDMTSYEAPGAFDLLLGTGIIKYIDQAVLPKLAQTWFQLLRPGGRIVFTESTYPNAPLGLHGYGIEESHRISENLRAKDWQSLGVNPDDAVAREFAYWSRLQNYRYQTVDQITAPFVAAGFVIERADTEARTAPLRGRSDPASMQVYARVVAAKP